MAEETAQLLYQAFQTCDRDQDGRLKVEEFLEFCETGLGKPQSDENMYRALCSQLGVDFNQGVSWSDISRMFQASNSAPIEDVDASPHDPYGRGSISHSHEERTSRTLTADNLYRHDRVPSTASIGDYGDDDGTFSQTSENRGHVRTSSMKRDSSMAEMAIIEALQGNNDKQHREMKRMGKEIKHLKKKLNGATRDRDQAFDQNQQLNQQLSALDAAYQRLEQEKGELAQRLNNDRNQYEQKIRLLQNQLDDDRKTITHLEGQQQQAQQERDQVLQLFKNAETQFENQLTTIKRKHKEQLEKVSVGFLQSLGVQPGQDVRQVVRDLQEEKRQLTTQVSRLAEQLTRKDKSLFEALQAIDILSTQQKLLLRGGGAGRRPSVQLAGGAGATPGGDEEMSSRFDKERNPDFFIQAMAGGSGSRRVSGPSALGTVSASQNNAHRPVGPEGQAKEYQFVANALAGQVMEREQEIENLRAANEVLGMQINRNNA